jgi:hypothetical protein
MAHQLIERFGWLFVVIAVGLEIAIMGNGHYSWVGVVFVIIGAIMIVISNELS